MIKNYKVLITTNSIYKEIEIKAEYFEIDSTRITFFERRRNENNDWQTFEVASFPILVASLIDPENYIGIL